jgi:hypothetical protein
MFPNSNKVDICEIDPASMSQRNKAGTTFLSSATPNISSQLRRYYAPPTPDGYGSHMKFLGQYVRTEYVT